MRTFFQKKSWIVLLAALALTALTVLALSLDEIHFKQGQPFGHSQQDTPLNPIENMFDNLGSVPWWQLIGFWSIVALLVVLIGLLLSPELRKRLLIMFVRMVLTFITFWLILRQVGDRLAGFQTAADAGLQQSQTAANQPPAPTFQPTHISPLFAYLVSFAVALGLLAIIWIVYRRWQRYAALKTKEPLHEIARIARTSLDDLSAGRDSSDVIINCYLRMSDVVSNKRQLRREIATTPQEFALRLERAGLPGDAVRRLTRLFEIVRYGDRKSAPRDVNEAISCLSTILHYCGEAP